ncbi:MAG: methylmalonyl-CoA mutase, partial [Bacteroidota bacterium]
PREVIRAEEWEKLAQIETLENLRTANTDKARQVLQKLSQTAVQNGNIFGELMETVKYCSLGEITGTLFNVGGQYRRNM